MAENTYFNIIYLFLYFNIYTIDPRDSLVGGAGKIIWIYRGLAITGFSKKSIYSMKSVILDLRKRLEWILYNSLSSL